MITNTQTAHNFANALNVYQCSNHMYWTNNGDGSRTIYSYGQHFPIATIKDNICLFTQNTWSNTTAHHVRNVARAVSHLDIIYIPNLAKSSSFNLDWMLKELQNIINKFATARKPELYLMQFETAYENALKYAVYIQASKEQIKEFIILNKTIKSSSKMNAVRAKLKRYRETERKQRKQAAKELKQKITAWENGKNIYLSNSDLKNNVPLRFESRKGYTIVKTAKGVEIPVKYAKDFALRLLSGTLQRWDKICGYTVNQITDKFVKIGCHTFNVKYLKAFAMQLQ